MEAYEHIGMGKCLCCDICETKCDCDDCGFTCVIITNSSTLSLFFVCGCVKHSLAIDILLPIARAIPNFLLEGVSTNVFGFLCRTGIYVA